MAKPAEPENIVIEQKKTDESIKALGDVETKGQEKKDIATVQTLDQGKTIGRDLGTAKIVGPEFYLCEITTFYERVITILSIIIFLILGLNFLYIHRSSKSQSEEMAVEALESKPFRITLKNMIVTEVNEFIDTEDEIPDLKKRIEFLEEQVNIKGYELSEEDSDEATDGNN
jgi:hypothetical protein